MVTRFWCLFGKWWRLEPIVLKLAELASRWDPSLRERVLFCLWFSFFSTGFFFPVREMDREAKRICGKGQKRFRSAVILFCPHFSLFLLKVSYLFNFLHILLTVVCNKSTQYLATVLYRQELLVAESGTLLLLWFECWVIIGLGSWRCC